MSILKIYLELTYQALLPFWSGINELKALRWKLILKILHFISSLQVLEEQDSDVFATTHDYTETEDNEDEVEDNEDDVEDDEDDVEDEGDDVEDEGEESDEKQEVVFHFFSLLHLNRLII